MQTIAAAPRINYVELAGPAIKGLFQMSQYSHNASIEHELAELVSLRASQINGCAYCLNMHSTDLRKHGYPQRKLDLLPAWHEVDDFTTREKAALAWTEVVTRLEGAEVPDTAYNAAREAFTEQELADLTVGIVVINSWNRFNVAFRMPPAAEE